MPLLWNSRESVGLKVLLVLGELGCNGIVIGEVFSNCLVIHFRVLVRLIFGANFNDFSAFNVLFLVLGSLSCR